MALTYVSAQFGLAVRLPVGAVWLGWGLILVGFMVMGAAAVTMLRQRTTLIPHRVPTALVTGGIFKFTRNPIYLGDAFTLAGFSLLCGNPAGIVLVPVFMAVIQKRFIVAEEARLRAEFGEAFPNWAHKTRRWM